MPAVGGLPAGRIKGDGEPVLVRLQMDLRAEPARCPAGERMRSPRRARPSGRLTRPPPFAPAAETCARMTVPSNIRTGRAVSLGPAGMAKTSSNTPARPSRSSRFRTPLHFPNRSGGARRVTSWTAKKRGAWQERPVILRLGSPRRQARPENLRRDLPIRLLHLQRHRRPSKSVGRP